jgi:hypothetical protein
VGENARRWRANRLRRNCTWTPSPDLRCAPLIRPRPLHQLTCAHRERICHWGLGSLGHTALLHPPAKAEARLMPFSPPRPPCGASPRCLSPPTRCVGHALTSPYRSCVPQRAAPRKFEVTRMKQRSLLPPSGRETGLRAAPQPTGDERHRLGNCASASSNESGTQASLSCGHTRISPLTWPSRGPDSTPLAPWDIASSLQSRPPSAHRELTTCGYHV